MRIKIAKKKHQKINTIDQIITWCDDNLVEMIDHAEHGCETACWWVEAMERGEREDTPENASAYVASILKYIASHHPHLLGSEYQWAVDIERTNGGSGTLQ